MLERRRDANASAGEEGISFLENSANGVFLLRDKKAATHVAWHWNPLQKRLCKC
jgi:hypothetical protein